MELKSCPQAASTQELLIRNTAQEKRDIAFIKFHGYPTQRDLPKQKLKGCDEAGYEKNDIQRAGLWSKFKKKIQITYRHSKQMAATA